MPSIVTILRSTIAFYREQGVLNTVALVLFTVPMSTFHTLLRFFEPRQLDTITLAFFFVFLLSLLITWGAACTLIIGKRLIEKHGGRSRSSFRALAKEAKRILIPLYVTGILRACITVLWSFPAIILLALVLVLPENTLRLPETPSTFLTLTIFLAFAISLIPAFLYSIRTSFYDIILVAENLRFRAALQRSTQVIRGHTGKVLLYLLVLSAVFFLPTNLLTMLLETAVVALDPIFLPASDIVKSGLLSIATILFTLSSIILFGAVKDLGGIIHEVHLEQRS